MPQLRWRHGFLAIGLVILFLSGCKTSGKAVLTPSSDEEKQNFLTIAQAIKAKYDQHIDKLPTYLASHYAARIYRISGDTSYLKYNLRDLQAMHQETEALLQTAKDHNEAQYSQAQLKKWRSQPRFALRRRTLTIAPEFFYYWNSLALLRRTLEYRVNSPSFDQLKQHVLAHDYTDYFNNPEMIKAWAAQLANVIVWIKQLGGKDYSALFIHTLQQTYPDNEDPLLSDNQFENKIYGLTHLVLAQSQYYQYLLNRSEFTWIFDYFDKNIDTILKRTKADVVAEVGIAYLLTQQTQHTSLKKAQHHIASSFDSKHHMIPSPRGKYAIATGAHRNILSIILLMAPTQWYPGPWLTVSGESVH